MPREDTFDDPVAKPSEQYVGWFPSRISLDRDELLDLMAGERTTVTVTARVFAHQGVTRQVAEDGLVTYDIAGGLNVGTVEAELTGGQVKAILAILGAEVRQALADKVGA